MTGFRAQILRGTSIIKDCWLDRTDKISDISYIMTMISYIMTKIRNYIVKWILSSLTIQTDNAGRTGRVKHYKSKGHKRIAEVGYGRVRGQLVLGLYSNDDNSIHLKTYWLFDIIEFQVSPLLPAPWAPSSYQNSNTQCACLWRFRLWCLEHLRLCFLANQ